MSTIQLRACIFTFLSFLLITIPGCDTTSSDSHEADWIIGEWGYYQTDSTTWLFDVNITRERNVYTVKLTQWNTSIYGSQTCPTGRVISELEYISEDSLFTGNHYSVENGGYLDIVKVYIISSNYLRYQATDYPPITGQSLQREN